APRAPTASRAGPGASRAPRRRARRRWDAMRRPRMGAAARGSRSARTSSLPRACPSSSMVLQVLSYSMTSSALERNDEGPDRFLGRALRSAGLLLVLVRVVQHLGLGDVGELARDPVVADLGLEVGDGLVEL